MKHGEKFEDFCPFYFRSCYYLCYDLTDTSWNHLLQMHRWQKVKIYKGPLPIGRVSVSSKCQTLLWIGVCGINLCNAESLWSSLTRRVPSCSYRGKPLLFSISSVPRHPQLAPQSAHSYCSLQCQLFVSPETSVLSAVWCVIPGDLFADGLPTTTPPPALLCSATNSAPWSPPPPPLRVLKHRFRFSCRRGRRTFSY